MYHRRKQRSWRKQNSRSSSRCEIWWQKYFCFAIVTTTIVIIWWHKCFVHHHRHHHMMKIIFWSLPSRYHHHHLQGSGEECTIRTNSPKFGGDATDSCGQCVTRWTHTLLDIVIIGDDAENDGNADDNSAYNSDGNADDNSAVEQRLKSAKRSQHALL